MATNINCKKKWHPSRYEVRKQVQEAEEVEQRKREEERVRKEVGRRETLEEEIRKSDTNRMSWML